MKSICLAFAMFSRIPMPRMEWDEKNMRYTMAAFPLVGVAAGLLILAWGYLSTWVQFGPLLRGAGFALLPLLITGGIHMDGFCDTVDALASHGDIAKKERILKDPHIGSFAAMMVCAYLIACFALAAEAGFSPRGLLCFALAFSLSRAVCGLSVLLFPCSPASSLGKCFQSAAAKGSSLAVLAFWVVCLGVLMPWLGGVAGLAAFVVPFALLGLCRRIASRQFGGMSGDLSGWLLQLCELSSLACLVVVPAIVGRL